MQEQYVGRNRMDVASGNKIPAKLPARSIQIHEAKDRPGQALLVAVTRAPEGGEKQTALGYVPGGELGARLSAELVARCMEHYTGQPWAYPGCNDARGGL